MSIATLTAGITAYAAQIALLLTVGLLLPVLFGRLPARARLVYWQGLLLAVVLLPLLQPRSGDAVVAGFTAEIRVAAPALAAAAGRAPISWLLFVLGVGAAVRLIWLLLGLVTLHAWRRGASPAALARVVTEVQTQVGAEARILVSDKVAGPVTFGWRNATVLVPPSFTALPAVSQRAVVCHELLHVRRRDWLCSLFEEAVRALLWFHPAVWLLLSRLALSREQVVDGEVVRLTGARRAYLEALRAFALQPRRAAVPGLPFFHHRSHLRERVAHLSKEVSMSRPRIATLITTFAAVLALTAFLGASSFPMLSSAWAKPMKVAGDVQPPKALSTPQPVYPETAKKAKTEGIVVVDCVINDQGHVTSTKVATSSGNQDLDKSARDTVNTWTFQPATLKGKPVEVSYTITIRFTLDKKDK
jgi:D-alanyl-D-alanine endopeptidase (penicillin-binding protein 7)